MKEITLTQGKIALVDDEDYEYLMLYAKRWQAVRATSGSWYAVGHKKMSGAGGQQYMHRVILRAPSRRHVDHKNRNTLDNRRMNLRFASRAQNGWNRGVLVSNTSGFKGVNKFRSRWQARITVDCKRIFIGYFDTPNAAAKAYDEHAKRLHGSFACLNFS